MNDSTMTPRADALRREIDRELDLVVGAARLVRTGAATRVTIGNLALVDAILEAARAAIAPLGARVQPLMDGAEAAHAVTVEPWRG
jgi:hypothetical protein